MTKYFYRFRFLGALVILAALAAFGAVVMLLWNALAPDIFGLPALGYWQATGLLALAKILFGGIVPGGGHSPHCHDGLPFGRGNRLREKWMNMTEEERKEFIKKERGFMRFHEGFSPHHPFFDDGAPRGGAGEEKGGGDA